MSERNCENCLTRKIAEYQIACKQEWITQAGDRQDRDTSELKAIQRAIPYASRGRERKYCYRLPGSDSDKVIGKRALVSKAKSLHAKIQGTEPGINNLQQVTEPAENFLTSASECPGLLPEEVANDACAADPDARERFVATVLDFLRDARPA